MADEQNQVSPMVDALRKFVAKKCFEELKAAWMPALEDASVTTDEFFCLLQALARKNAALTENLFWFTLTDRAERNGPAEALCLVQRAAGLPPSKPADAFLPCNDPLRNETASLYRRVHAETTEIEALIRMTLLVSEIPLAKGIEQIEKLIALRPGCYVLDRKAPGRVAGIRADQLAVEFLDGERTYDALAIDQLDPIPPDDFRARVTFELATLKALAHDDPAGLVVLALRAQGPFLTFRELKSCLTPVLPGTAWTKWWTDARPKIKRAPLVQMSDDTQPTFGLRMKPIAYEDDVKTQFTSAADPAAKMAVALDYVNETGGAGARHQVNPELLTHLAERVAAIGDELKTGDPLLAACSLAVRAEMHKHHARLVAAPPSPGPLLFPNGELVPLRPIQNDRLVRCTFAFVRASLPDHWHQVCAAVLPGSKQETCDWIAAELSGGGFAVEIDFAIPAILARPDQNADALIWLWKSAMSGKFPEALAEANRLAIASRLLAAAEALAKRVSAKAPEHKQMLTAVVRALQQKDHDYFRAALEGAAADQIKVIRTVVERNIGLTDHARNQLLDVIRHAHPAMFAKNVEPWEDEHVVYTSEAGLKRRQEELYHLVNVKLSEASQAVGRAAEDGNLSENFAWTAALAERDRLAGTATRMQAEISKARIITAELAGNCERVTIGCAVDARDPATDQKKTFLFLGPWDGDHDKGVYSYTATLGRAFMGKKRGDVVTHAEGRDKETWEIVDIRSGV